MNQNNKSSLEKVSIKNLSSCNDIDLVSNTSLAPVLDYELGKAEQMHLANIFAAHSDKDIAFKSSAQKLIENLVIQTAVRGYSKQNRPTMFMAINSSAQQVHIYDINILISQLLNNEIKHSKIIIKTIDNDLSEPKTRSQMLADTATVFDKFRQQKINFQMSLALK